VDQVTWCQTGKVGIMGEGLECNKEKLYASIYLDIKDVRVRQYCGRVATHRLSSLSV